MKEYYRLIKKGGHRSPILLYAQTSNDTLYFGKIPKYLKKYQAEFVYITSDPIDPFSKNNPENSFFLGAGFFLLLFFVTNKAKFFLTTQPDLQTTYFKRSLNDVHYCYIFHSLISTHIGYKKSAFDAYDSILLGGEHHKREIQEKEVFDNLKKKKLIQAGYPRVDDLSEKRPKSEDNKLTSILLAPSWGANSISETCLYEVIETLLKMEHKIIYRPHPMTINRNKTHSQEVLKFFKNDTRLIINDELNNDDHLLTSKVLVTDWSGIAFDFSLGLLKPTVFINLPIKSNNLYSEEQMLSSAENQCRNDFGAIVEADSLYKLTTRIEEVNKNAPHYTEKLEELRKKYTYNFGRSAKIAAKHILETIEERPHHPSKS
jgi:hypothetical protein